jgi:hypothetical protein
MTTKAVWIGITVGVFFAGLGIGFMVFSPNITVTTQQMQQMMNNPTMMAQWHQSMMNNPQVMNNWMNTMMQNPNTMTQLMETLMANQQSVQQMHNSMINNPQHMQTMVGMMGPSMMGYMMNNPQMNQQMMNMMLDNQQFMHEMMMNTQFQQNWMGPWMNNSTNWNSMMDSGWMNRGMMDQGMGSMGRMMMGSPITSDTDVLKVIANIEDLLDQVSSTYRDGDSTKALSLATTAYLENYEYIEGKLSSYDQQLMEKVELMLRKDLRQMINTGESADDIDTHITAIKKELKKAKQFFQ